MALMNGTLECETVVPDRSQSARDVIPRWSETHVELPALIIRPTTEADILEAVKIAKDRNLTLLPAGGAHASFVPVDSNTLYLDLRHFNDVTVDKATQTVRVGGGALTGDVVKATTAEGFYTLWPNSNAVGYVGCILGGGNGATNGLHGFMIDAVDSFRLITCDGRILDLNSLSTGEEKALFGALCGAGHGLGIVTSVVMKAFPIEDLGMKDNSIWTRRLMFPPTALDIAAKTFAQFQELAPALILVLLFLRAPPNAPNPGAPMVMLTASYYGPPHDAEMAAAPLFDQKVTDQVFKAETVFVPMASVNNGFDVFSRHGGHKGISSAFLHSVDAATLVASFQEWVKVGNVYSDAMPTVAVWSRFSTQMLLKLGPTSDAYGKFTEVRDRGVLANWISWCNTPETNQALAKHTDKFLRIARRNQSAPARTFPNNQHLGGKLEDLHSEDRLAELRRLKSVWDPDHLFWNQY